MGGSWCCRRDCSRRGSGGRRPADRPARLGRPGRAAELTALSTLFLVHAHPDDEAIMTGGAMAKAHQEGHRVVLVTATRGEVGEISNMDEASSRPRLAEIRTEEMRRAGEILGVSRQEYLGYRDSGMAGTADTPEEMFELAFGTERYVLVRGEPAARPETDLFQGITGGTSG